MIHREFRWDNTERFEAKYGHQCFYGPDAGHSDADLGGGGSTGDGHPDHGMSGTVSSGSGATTEHGGFDPSHKSIGHLGGLLGMAPSPGTGMDKHDVGDGAAAAACEARGGTWDSSNMVCNMPDDSDDDDGGDDGGGDDGGGDDGGGGEEPENEADKKFAKLLRDQWADYKKRWLPVEKEMSKLLTSDDFGEDVVNKARRAGLAMDSTDQTMRQLDRYGVELGTRQRQALLGSATKNRYAQAVGAANKTRVGMVDLKDALQKDMIGIGHGVGASATAGLGAAAQMEIQRGAAIAGMKNQHAYMQASLGMQQQNYQNQFKYAQKSQNSGIFGLVGTAIGGYFGGPVGAMIGGGIGSMLG